MFESIRAAEKAAIDGEGGSEWDTQCCLALQDDLLSSPAPTQQHATIAVAALAVAVASTSTSASACVSASTNISQAPADEQIHAGDSQAPVGGQLGLQSPSHPPPAPASLLPRNNAVSQKPPNKRIIEIEPDGRIRIFDATEKELLPSAPGNIKQRYRGVMADYLGDLTQRSSMSLTQENPLSAYDQYNLNRRNYDENPPTADDDPDEGPTPLAAHDSYGKHASTRTESTAFTYQENDTGHIKLDFNPEPLGEQESSGSQDASYAAPHIEQHSYAQSFGPHTPAPPQNPFAHQGSVLKPSQMFGATQPSSVGRNFAASPTSSRPSPDVYNNFTSPAARNRIDSSPLARRPETEDSTPLQSSVRKLLTRDGESPEFSAPRTPGVRSFDTGPSKRMNTNEPRPYVSMKESQERRRQQELSQDDSSNGSDSDIGDVPRKRKREEQIRRELSAVIRMPTTRTKSESPAAVEVPSTTRRRSYQDDYLAQCSGFDARDSQQTDEFVADSQALPDQYRPVDETEMLGEHSESSPSKAGAKSNGSPKAPTPKTNTPSGEDSETVANDRSVMNLIPEPSLPLQELSSNRSNLRTPIANKMQSSEPLDTVPETSPTEDGLRPMREIASLSFGRETEGETMEGLPGFTQDAEFETAMGYISAPAVPPTSNTTPTHSRVTTTVIEQPLSISENNPIPPTSVSTEADTNRNLATAAEVVVVQGPSTTSEQFAAIGNAVSFTDRVSPAAMESNTEEFYTGIASEVSKTDAQAAVTGIGPNLDGGTESKDVAEADGLKPTELSVKELSSSTRTRVLRTKSQLKGPSRALRRSEEGPASDAVIAPPVLKKDFIANKSPKRSSNRKSNVGSASSMPEMIALPPSSVMAPNAAPSAPKQVTPALPPSKHRNRLSTATPFTGQEVTPLQTRSSKRQSTVREDSLDPLALPPPSSHKDQKTPSTLFKDMVFAVSYVKQESEKDNITNLIVDNGGRILQDGFDILFDVGPKSEDEELLLASTATTIGFTALIADEHSRKAKYMQALALGLPCISGRWISACVTKGVVINWSPYLLCAGQSSFLGNAFRSRTLQPYSAVGARLANTFKGREKILEGRSILLVTGRGKVDKRKAYVFLTRALGPARIAQVGDYSEAREKLVESEARGAGWDLLYVDNERAAESAVFSPAATSKGSSTKKRKRGPTPAKVGDSQSPPPKKIRVISDETMIQSLILGHLLEE